MERNLALVNLDLFADISCDSPLTDDPGLSPNEPMAIVQADVQVESPLPVEVTSIPEGRYLIKIQAANIYWEVWKDTITMVYYWSTTMERAKKDLSFERAFSNYSSVQRIILFKCGTSHKIKMVTSL